MPLRASVVPAPPVTTPPGPVAERLAATWTAPDGTVVPLTTRPLGWWLMSGAIFQGAVPVTVTTDPNPRGGATVRHVQPEPRVLVFPMHVKGKTHVEFLVRWRFLASKFTQTRRRGPGVLTMTRPDGTSRQISAWYQSGFDEQPGFGWLFDQPVLMLLCEDPFWTDVTDTTVLRSFSGGDADSFLSPFPHITDSRVLGDTVITVDGDAEVWPVWTITGPGSGVTATNNDTGEEFVLTPIGGDLMLGDTVTITTDPPAIIGPDGSSWIGAINFTGGAVLWALQPGDNDVSFVVAGADTGTSITLAYRTRYETA
jgi:hypothetical protein